MAPPPPPHHHHSTALPPHPAQLTARPGPPLPLPLPRTAGHAQEAAIATLFRSTAYSLSVLNSSGAGGANSTSPGGSLAGAYGGNLTGAYGGNLTDTSGSLPPSAVNNVGMDKAKTLLASSVLDLAGCVGEQAWAGWRAGRAAC